MKIEIISIKEFDRLTNGRFITNPPVNKLSDLKKLNEEHLSSRIISEINWCPGVSYMAVYNLDQHCWLLFPMSYPSYLGELYSFELGRRYKISFSKEDGWIGTISLYNQKDSSVQFSHNTNFEPIPVLEALSRAIEDAKDLYDTGRVR